ncbi:unnamed protein product [Didymodactylos carnosus]|uniref:Uncharacterized protein n=1 Tax=Didymodactylos carnosus TaxID=1234261 RepID=A0A813Z4F1_9BILA|nr:unnamed protein product [Didymodactylos carnosus]CAF3677001.1 unnamed protein product [Didymodactylos carnosus]
MLTSIFYLFFLTTIVTCEDFSSITNKTSVIAKLYLNSAEIAYKIAPFQLPVAFSNDEWSQIRPETIRLSGRYIQITSQIIKQEKTSLNGHKVLICQSNCSQTIEVLMIDDKINLVKDLKDGTYFIIGDNERIKYFDIPPTAKYMVDFTFETLRDEYLYLQMINNQLKWQAYYDLLLEDNDEHGTTLIGYADMQNSGVNTIRVDDAELFGGDITIKAPSYFKNGYANGESADINARPEYNAPPPSVSLGQELQGIYVFKISKPFAIEANTNYILPMVRPTIEVERYVSIEKYFQQTNNAGNPERMYRLKSDQFLPKGNAFVRENNRLVGETLWPDQTANNTYAFALGKDYDVTYSETVTLLANESSKPISDNILISQYQKSTKQTYLINLKLENFKGRTIRIEYTQQLTGSLNYIFQAVDNNSNFKQVGSNINANFTLSASESQEHKYRIVYQTQN